MENDTLLKDRTNLPTVTTIMELLSVCVNSSYFQVEDQFYKQALAYLGGGWVGLLIHILSYLFMDSFEERLFNLNDISSMKPNLRLKSVDNVFCLWKGRMSDLTTLSMSILIITNK